MPFGARLIPPLDTRPGTGIGIALPFNAPAVFFTTYTTKDAIRNNILNFFLTNKSERYLNNNFGANLRAFIFEQITKGNLDYLKSDIQSLLKVYFNNISIESLDILQNPDNNEITVSFTYSIINTGLNDQINITFG
jgi:phage baseplate assembly protein W